MSNTRRGILEETGLGCAERILGRLQDVPSPIAVGGQFTTVLDLEAPPTHISQDHLETERARRQRC